MFAIYMDRVPDPSSPAPRRTVKSDKSNKLKKILFCDKCCWVFHLRVKFRILQHQFCIFFTRSPRMSFHHIKLQARETLNNVVANFFFHNFECIYYLSWISLFTRLHLNSGLEEHFQCILSYYTQTCIYGVTPRELHPNLVDLDMWTITCA